MNTAPHADSLAVVDSENKFLRWSDRKEVHSKHLPHRSVQVFVFDSQNRMVIQKRHRDKLTYPSYWDMSCSGHVEASDYHGGPDENIDMVYRSVAARELAEEIDVVVAGSELEFLGHFKPLAEVHYEHFYLYKTVSDGPYTIQVEELEAVDVVDRQQFEQMLANPTCKLTETLKFLVKWLIDHDSWPSQ